MSTGPDLNQLDQLARSYLASLEQAVAEAPTEDLRRQAQAMAQQFAAAQAGFIEKYQQVDQVAQAAIDSAQEKARNVKQAVADALGHARKKEQAWQEKQAKLKEKRASKRKPVNDPDPALGGQLRVRLLERVGRRRRGADQAERREPGDLSDWLKS